MKRSKEIALMALRNPTLHAWGEGAVLGIGVFELVELAFTAFCLPDRKANESLSCFGLKAYEGIVTFSAALIILLTQSAKYEKFLNEEDGKAVWEDFNT